MNDRMEELRSPLEKYRERIEAQRKDPAYREEVNRKLAEMVFIVNLSLLLDVSVVCVLPIE